MVVLGLLSLAGFAQNVSINADGTIPNANAMLDVASPATGAGKGLLIPRVTEALRTTADAGLAGGLLDDAGDLRGGAARGLLVYQTDGTIGFYYNTSATATPSWLWLRGDPSQSETVLGANGVGTVGRIVLHDAQAGDDFTVTLQAADTIAASTTFKLPAADGSANQVMKTDGAGNLAFASVSVPLGGTTITIGDSATTDNNGVAIGVSANGTTYGAVVGYQANASMYGTAFGYQANGYDSNVAVGYKANGYVGTGPYSGGVAIGYSSNSYSGAGKYSGGVAIGYYANARHNANENDVGAVAVGCLANAFINGVAIGRGAAGYYQGVAVGLNATGSSQGVGIGYRANGYVNGTALGYRANSGNQGYAVAKGSYTRCMRYNEEFKGSDTLVEDPATGALAGYNKYGYGQSNFHGATANNVATEIYLGGVVGKRLTLQDNSVVTFEALVSGINTVTGDSSGWKAWGVIKRRAGAATTIIVGTITVDAQTQGALTTAPTFTADTTNGSLKVTVTGIAATTVQWNTMIQYSEVRE
jgi:hypothetical protein